jgi:hypothetical protein
MANLTLPAVGETALPEHYNALLQVIGPTWEDASFGI